MSDPKTISPYFCLPLLEESVADDTHAPAAFQLPQSFPAELLDDDQLETIAAWFDTWVADLLHSIRLALLGHTHTVSKHQGATPADLAHLTQHAVALCHLLRLHPAAEASITELAAGLGVPRRALYYARDAVLQHIRPALAGTIARSHAAANAYAQLAAIGTLDTAQATTLDTRTILVPFKPAVYVAHRFATVQQLAALPGVASAREELTPSGKNAVLITIK